MSDSIKYEVGHKVRLKPEITDARLIEIGVNDKAFRGRLLKGEAAEVILERQQDKDPPHEHGGILRLSYKGLDSRWVVYVDMVIPVTPYFRKGDPVRVHATKEQLERIGIEEDYADELVAGLTGEFNKYSPEDREFPYGADFKTEDGEEHDWGFEDGMLQPVAFRPGDRVRCVATPEELESMGIGPERAYKEIKESVGVVVAQSGEVSTRVKFLGGAEWFINPNKLILAVEDEADVEVGEDEAEPEWDPMTEPLSVGDHVELVRKNRARTGTTGVVHRVYERDGSTVHALKYDEDGHVEDGGWFRDGLKLLKKGDGTASKAKVKDEPPPPKVAVGDKVKITHSTKELQAIGYDVVDAARRAGKLGEVKQVYDSAPQVLVHVESIGETAWCNFDGVEKAAA